MKKYELVIFDLDGTLADTSEGIINAHRYANAQMNRERPEEQELRHIIGASLLDTYIYQFGYQRCEAEKAVRIYRDWYGKYGVKEAELYQNIDELLQILYHKGCKLAVATLKAENLAREVLANLGIDHFFNLIHGVDTKDRLSKCDLINMCISELECEKAASILVGDSMHDMAGAEEAGIDFVGVTYGFGHFAEGQMYENMKMTIADPLELLRIL